MNGKEIITVEQMRSIRPIADNIQEAKRIAPYIEEAEKLFVLEVLTPFIYQQLIALNSTSSFPITLVSSNNKPISFSKERYDILYTGGFYNSICSYNEVKHCVGLIEAVSYIAYSRMLYNNELNVTAFGVVKKKTASQFSEPIDEGSLNRAARNAEKIGLNYLHQCVNFLRDIDLISVSKKTTWANKYKKLGK